jgi:hypothetical protein
MMSGSRISRPTRPRTSASQLSRQPICRLAPTWPWGGIASGCVPIDAAGTPAMWSKPSDFVVAPAPTPRRAMVANVSTALRPFRGPSLKGASSFQVTVVNKNTSTVVHNVTGLTGLSWTVPADLVDGTYEWWVSGVSQDGYKSACSAKDRVLCRRAADGADTCGNRREFQAALYMDQRNPSCVVRSLGQSRGRCNVCGHYSCLLA